MVDKLSKELEQADTYYVNRFMTTGVIRDFDCKPFGKLQRVILLCSEVLLRVKSDVSLGYFTTYTFRRSCSSPPSKFTRNLLRN